MEWLNYHHLYYFWVVAKEGSITAACHQLHLAQPTVSAQLRALEQALDCKLFTRLGRRLVLTEVGRAVYHRADEIFHLGRDLVDALKKQPASPSLPRFNVGVVDVLPKLVVYRLLQPVTRPPHAVCVVCQEGKHKDLLAKLSVYEVDLVLTDLPLGPDTKVRAFTHLLGECGVSVFGAAELAARHRRRFPRSLHGAPFLLPTANMALRRSLDYWFEDHGIAPAVVGEFEDSALLKVFGQGGLGLFVMPAIVEKEVQQRFKVELVGRIEDVKDRFYAISTERHVRHPAVLAITAAAHKSVFDRPATAGRAATACGLRREGSRVRSRG